MAKTPLTAIPGIGPATAARLEAAGITSAEALIAAPQDLLAGLPGFVPARADRVLAAARELVAIPASAHDRPGGKKGTKKDTGAKPATSKDEKKKKNKAKDKKGKKKDERKRAKAKHKKKSDKKKTKK